MSDHTRCLSTYLYISNNLHYYWHTVITYVVKIIFLLFFFLDTIINSLKNEKPENFSRVIIVHSAAMATFSQLTTEMTDFDEWHKCFHLNVFAPAVINGVLFKIFSNQSIKKNVIHICSYWSIKPDPYAGSYCSAKAAVDMFFKVKLKRICLSI